MRAVLLSCFAVLIKEWSMPNTTVTIAPTVPPMQAAETIVNDKYLITPGVTLKFATITTTLKIAPAVRTIPSINQVAGQEWNGDDQWKGGDDSDAYGDEDDGYEDYGD